MKNLFAYDSPLMRCISGIGTMICTSVLWLLCCIPIVTIGASTAALYRIMFNLREDKATHTADFFRAFASNFKQGTVIWLLILASGLILWLFHTAIGFYQTRLIQMILLALFFCFVLLAMGTAMYAFPLICYFTNSVRRTLSNALLLALSNPVRTLGAILLSLLPVAICLFMTQFFLTLLVLFLAVVPALLAYAIVCVIKPVFDTLISKEEEEE